MSSREIDQSAERKIIHVDMDAFFASVEQRDFPEYRGKPLVVGGSAQGRGVIAAASYEARKFGVRSAMSSAQANKLCPDLIFARHRFEVYQEVSQAIRKIFRSITDLVEPLSLDEAYLDVTQSYSDLKYASEIARYIKEEIKQSTRLTASAGVGPNKFIAKIASDWNKPDGLTVIPPWDVEKFVAPLSVEKFWGVGPATAKRLHGRGYYKATDLRQAGPELLVQEFGKFGFQLFEMAWGRDRRKVGGGHRQAKSRGAERTYSEDVLDATVIAASLEDISSRLSASLKRMDCFAKTLTLKLRYHNFHTITRSSTSPIPLEKSETLFHKAIELLQKTEAGKIPVRLVGLSVSGLYQRNQKHNSNEVNLPAQLSLWPEAQWVSIR